jgi:hypothetical protein
MKILVNLKRLSNPRIRRRLKIGLSVWAGVIVLGLSYKLVYEIGYFDAKSIEKDKNAYLPFVRPVLTIESAQRIVAGALKEDPASPKTIVDQVIDNDHKLSTIIIEDNKQKKIAWIIDMRLFFIADVFNKDGYNLTKGFEQQYDTKHGEH